MHFDGLIRKLHAFYNFDQGEYDREFTLLRHNLHVRRTAVDPMGSRSKNGDFADSHWQNLYSELQPEICVELNDEEKFYLDDFLERLLARLDHKYRVVLVQLAWFNPGERVLRHADGRIIFKKARRFNLFFDADDLAYTCYHGNDGPSVKIDVKSGDLFELNNRSYHKAENLSIHRVSSLLVIDLLEVDAPPLTQADYELDRTGISATDHSPVVIWE